MENNLKNIKVSEKHHKMLKEHCDKNGLKIYGFLEKLIYENCKQKVDIYGDPLD